MGKTTLHTWPGFALPDRPPCPTTTPFGIKVQRILQYKGVDFSWRVVEWADAAEVMPGLSSSGKLPILEMDGKRIEDSTPIAWWIEARHPEPALVPTQPGARGRVDLLEQWADDVLYRYRQYAELHFASDDQVRDTYYADRPPELADRLLLVRRKGMEVQLHHQGIGRYPEEAFVAEFDRSLDGLAALAAEQGFLVGDRLSLADVAVFAHFHRVLCGTDPWYEERLVARPALMDWIDKVDHLTAGGVST